MACVIKRPKESTAPLLFSALKQIPGVDSDVKPKPAEEVLTSRRKIKPLRKKKENIQIVAGAGATGANTTPLPTTRGANGAAEGAANASPPSLPKQPKCQLRLRRQSLKEKGSLGPLPPRPETSSPRFSTESTSAVATPVVVDESTLLEDYQVGNRRSGEDVLI